MTEVRVPKDMWDTTKRPEAVIINWFYRDRATVGAGVPLVEIMVEKAQFEIVSPAAGVLRILAPPETVVTPGTVIARIG